MDRRLLEAALSGDAAEIKHLAVHEEPGVLLGTTPQGNTCLHIAAMHGHEEFCKYVLALNQSLPDLLAATNEDGETPLLTAITRGRVSVASVLLSCCRDRQLSETILKKQDKRRCNALHHAIRRGYRTLALELMEAAPGLSEAVNQRGDSPLFIAAMRNYEDVLNKLLGYPDSGHSGALGFNVLHAAVTIGNPDMAKKVMETRPWLAEQENKDKRTPIHLAAMKNRVNVLAVLLEHDPSLGYLISTGGAPLLCVAACKGHVGVARELLKHCPDAPYWDAINGLTCLHEAVLYKQSEFVEFVLGSQQLQHLINMEDNSGQTAQQLASRNGLTSLAARLRDQSQIINNASNGGAVAEHTASNIDEWLLKAAVTGDARLIKDQASHDPSLLLGSTPQGNTCLHIAAMHGREGFCTEALGLEPSLVAAVNSDGETPLLIAVANGRDSVASVLLSCCRDPQLREAILKQDSRGCNALHHAIRSGHRKLALDLIEAEPALSHAVNRYDESPMFIAVMRNYGDVFEKLLEIPDSAHGGTFGMNALHAAVRNGNPAIAKRIMEARHALAREEDKEYNTPMHLAVLWDKIDVLRVLLEHDRSLGYVVSSSGNPLLVCAAYRGHAGVARELLKHCPDAPSCRTNGWTCLHEAVCCNQMEFVEFVLDVPQLRGLVNMRNSNGDTALHLAVRKCNPKMVAALLLHRHIDVAVLNNTGYNASWNVSANQAKTLNWNEVSMLMLKADPQDTTIYNLHKQVKDNVIDSSRKDIKSLTQTYTSNTSLVAILIATITFAAAFTLPGGYSADAGNEGLPVMTRKFAFKAFLISDTLAMCSSLAIAFVCVIARWEDLEFLLYYRSFTKKLLWFAYMATTTAFATGLYTILAPHLLWLAVVVCVLTSLLPILTKLLGEWPVLKLRFRLRRTFKSELLNMV